MRKVVDVSDDPRLQKVILNMVAALKKEEAELSGPEVLAIVANVLGIVIAGQDPTVFTVEEIRNMVNANMEMGNRMAVRVILAERKPAGTA